MDYLAENALQNLEDNASKEKAITQLVEGNGEKRGGQSDANGQDEASRLKAWTTNVLDQDDLERDINRQVPDPNELEPLETLTPHL